jgi:hypothetical protein
MADVLSRAAATIVRARVAPGVHGYAVIAAVYRVDFACARVFVSCVSWRHRRAEVAVSSARDCDLRRLCRSLGAAMSSKATILIVDDEPDLREVLEEYFASQGFIALSAESATAARALAASIRSTSHCSISPCPGKTGSAWRATCASATASLRSSC